MELKSDLPPAIPEGPGAAQPELTLLKGGLAVEQTVEVVPTISSMTDAEFRDHVHTQAFADNALDSLNRVDREISAETAEITVRISELTQQLHTLYDRKRWVKGYKDDR